MVFRELQTAKYFEDNMTGVIMREGGTEIQEEFRSQWSLHASPQN